MIDQKIRPANEQCGVIASIVPHILRKRTPAAKLLDFFEPSEIEQAVEVLIEALDSHAGDNDIELNGDEEDSDGDERGDQAFVEWTTLPACRKRGPSIAVGFEDDELSDHLEEDDHSGQCSEDELSCGPGHWGGLYYRTREKGPGCELSDPGSEHDEHNAVAQYPIDQTKPVFSLNG